ncbi:hypothetical protein J4Q44_G00354730 [Coregonus suidteri]|uniref:Uncharacterized protein n=1 Tax=Coregonus suidteri TaxID=861788 RepID=A0AAN8KNX7_9TELE
MKYQKYITVMQMAMGVTAFNRDNCIPPKRQMWVTPTDGLSGIGATGIGTAASSAAITEAQDSAEAAAENAAAARAAARAGAMCGSGAIGGCSVMFATSTLSLPMSQGKPSLRRIKGRIHRSKSLDSIDLLDSNFSEDMDNVSP